MKFSKIILPCLLCILCLTVALGQKVTPELEEFILNHSPEQDELIPVEINFRSSINVDDYTPMQLDARRKQFIADLMIDAKVKQKSAIEALKIGMIEGKVDDFQSFWIVNMITTKVTYDYLAELQNNSEIEYLDYNEGINLIPTAPTDVNLTHSENINGLEPGLRIINADELWALGYTGQGRIMMIMDSGVDGDHPALASKWYGNQSGVSNADAWLDLRDPSSPSNGPTDTPTDSGGHGTWVAGIMGGTNVGVAYNAKWIAANPIFERPIPDNPTNENTSRILQDRTMLSFQWAVNLDNAPDVINCSWVDDWAQKCGNNLYEEMITNVENAGIAVVFSAGNNNNNLYDPANINTSLVNTFTVGNNDGDR